MVMIRYLESKDPANFVKTCDYANAGLGSWFTGYLRKLLTTRSEAEKELITVRTFVVER